MEERKWFVFSPTGERKVIDGPTGPFELVIDAPTARVDSIRRAMYPDDIPDEVYLSIEVSRGIALFNERLRQFRPMPAQHDPGPGQESPPAGVVTPNRIRAVLSVAVADFEREGVHPEALRRIRELALVHIDRIFENVPR